MINVNDIVTDFFGFIFTLMFISVLVVIALQKPKDKVRK
jgi:hypothetical protein